MIKGIVFIEKALAQFVVIYESDKIGVPIKRNGKYINTTSNLQGEYSINLPKNNTTFISYQLVGANKITIPTIKVPQKLILSVNNFLPEQEVVTSKLKKFNYLWLLLLIPIIYKLSKKK